MTAKGSRPAVCVAVADHWSYIGVGWSMGIESSVASLRDAFSLAESELAAKTSINFDAYAYELLECEFPHVAARLREMLLARRVDVVGGSFAQPLGSTISGESNLRQLVEGRKTIREALGFEVETFLEQEEFTHPQIPQLLLAAGYRYASLAQSDTWGRQGVPVMDAPVVDWVGADGSTIRAATRTPLCFHTWGVDWRRVLGSSEFAQVAAHGVPLIIKWEEFGWNNEAIADADGLVRSLSGLAEVADARFVTIGEYLESWCVEVPTVKLVADDWRRLLAWGIGGDQLRRAERQTEAALLDAETLDAIAHVRGAHSEAVALAAAWRELMAAQSHDAALCEYTVSVFGPPPLHPREEFYNASWGSIAFEKLRGARREAVQIRESAMRALVGPGRDGGRDLTVFNAMGHSRLEVVCTPLLVDLPAGTLHLAVESPEGTEVPAQIVEAARSSDGSLTAAQLIFPAEVAPLAAATYRLRPVRNAPAASELVVSDEGARIANPLIEIEIDPRRGGIASLSDRDGRTYLAGASPKFSGQRNPHFPLTGIQHYFDPDDMEHIPPDIEMGRSAGPHEYDSARHEARIDVVERGPVRATVRCVTTMPLVRLETYVSLDATSPTVGVQVRVMADVPPDPGIEAGSGRWVPVDFPADGYWLRFDAAFPIRQIVRDLPFLVERTDRETFEGLTFVDLVGDDRALLLAHGGTQHFRRNGDAQLWNLVMREWESYFGNHFGWPSIANYHYRLIPHGTEWSNLRRREAASELLRPLAATPGGLPVGRVAFGKKDGPAELSSLRVADGDRFEARLVEYDGARGEARLELDGEGVEQSLRPFGIHTLGIHTLGV